MQVDTSLIQILIKSDIEIAFVGILKVNNNRFHLQGTSLRNYSNLNLPDLL